MRSCRGTRCQSFPGSVLDQFPLPVKIAKEESALNQMHRGTKSLWKGDHLLCEMSDVHPRPGFLRIAPLRDVARTIVWSRYDISQEVKELCMRLPIQAEDTICGMKWLFPENVPRAASWRERKGKESDQNGDISAYPLSEWSWVIT
jgi:hypothetical protein